MHKTRVRELSIDIFEVGHVAEGQVIDLELVVKRNTFHLQVHQNVAKSVMTDVEVSGDANSLCKTLNSATLTICKLFFNSICNFKPIGVPFLPRLDRSLVTVRV